MPPDNRGTPVATQPCPFAYGVPSCPLARVGKWNSKWVVDERPRRTRTLGSTMGRPRRASGGWGKLAANQWHRIKQAGR